MNPREGIFGCVVWAFICLELTGPALSQAARQPQAPPFANAEEDGQWTMPAKNFAGTRYSDLSEINAENVKNLQVAFTFSTGVNRGQESAPLVAAARCTCSRPIPNILYALDLSQPGAPMKWQYNPKPDAAAQGVACCDVVNRGPTYRQRQASSSPRSTRTWSRWMPRRARRCGRPSSATSTAARP